MKAEVELISFYFYKYFVLITNLTNIVIEFFSNDLKINSN